MSVCSLATKAGIVAALLIYICLSVAGVLILRCGCVDICGFVPSGGQLWGLPSISWPHPGGKGGEGWVRWITTRRKRGDRCDKPNLKIEIFFEIVFF